MRELAFLLVRLSGLALIAEAVTEFVRFCARPHSTTFALGSGWVTSPRDLTAEVADEITTLMAATVAIDVALLAAGLYCLFGGRVLVDLLCRPVDVPRAA